ncbi:MAG: MATE family efflux transporter [Syntrophomonadaceae bacterium]|nr:MATE family efflux transporter [Syntrophomonadaceae bacterium]
MDRTEEMRSASLGRLLFKFSLPAIIGMLVNSLYNVIDRIFLGRGIGQLAIAATTVAFPIMTILMAVSILIGVGATALISIRLGQQRKAEAEVIAGNAVVMIILLPALCALFFFLYTEPVLIFLGASQEVLPYARDFTEIIMLGAVFGSFSMGVNNFIRAEGNPKVSMYTQLLGAVINVILNYLFIFEFGWGMKGSAFATILAQFISALWVLSYFLTGRSLVKLRFSNMRLQWSVLTSIMAIGFAPFAMQIAASIQQVILNRTLMVHGGDSSLSAIGIIMSIAMLLFMPVLGVSQGEQPIIGYNYGARQYDRVRGTWKLAVLAGTAIALTGYLALRIWPEQLVGLFCKGDTELIALTTHAMLIYMALIPLVGFQIVSSTYFQAVGKARQAAVLSLSRQILFFIPLLLILPHYWGVEGVWRAAPISDFLAICLTATFMFFEMRSLKKAELGDQIEKHKNQDDIS